MEVHESATRHLIAAKSSLIRCGIELQKMPFPMEHGLKLMQMVQQLDRIQAYMQSDRGQTDAANTTHGKSKKRSRLAKKQSQSTPEKTPEIVQPKAGEVAPGQTGSKILKQFTGT